jgi:hypothetical protein
MQIILSDSGQAYHEYTSGRMVLSVMAFLNAVRLIAVERQGRWTGRGRKDTRCAVQPCNADTEYIGEQQIASICLLAFVLTYQGACILKVLQSDGE